ncbi:MAG: DUF1080 domain-containing protein [Pirellulaceae bacterium]|nr:DUF1080 domain-containing protein [Pirellulaceae bacterium]
MMFLWSSCVTSEAQELPPTIQRLLKKAQTAVAEVQKRVEAGDVPQDVITRLQELDGLMKADKHAEAEVLLDGALNALGIDPKTLKKKGGPTGDAPPQPKPPSSVDGPLPAFDPAGFTRIFDGQTLTDWDGDPTYWSVVDGNLVGTVTPETLLKKNSWIVWRGGLVEDFELVLDYRVSAQGNSGVGYRLAVLDGDPFSVRGPQADIHGADMFTGICYEENGRRLLASRGQSTWIDEPGTHPRLIAQFGDPEQLQGVARKEDWNRYRLVVKGQDAKHFLNGVLMSEVHDHDETNRMKRGLLGVQVHVGPPMKIEYRDIYLKHLGAAPQGDAARPSVVYRSGELLELEHPPSFENLSGQAARLTAPVKTERVNDQDELRIVTRNLAIVRHDLNDIKLFGGSKPYRAAEQLFDLVVAGPDLVVRVPKAGFRLIGRPLDREYRAHLRWNADGRHYDLVSLDSVQRGDPPKSPARRQSFRLGSPAVLRSTTGLELPEWADVVQTFIMLPVRPDRARQLHVSVNGAWAGIPGKYSILPHNPAIQQEYQDDQAAFAADVRKAGLIVPASINTIEGFHALRESVPNLEDMACRNAAGEVVVAGEMILMCSINPDWVQWEIDTGKAAIDAGAQWILLDTPMGASFISGFLKAGHCEHCAANFRSYLDEHYSATEQGERFGIDPFDRSEIARRLTSMQRITPMADSAHLNETTDARLFREFIKCQEETNFATRRHVMETLHRYANERDAKVVFCTNAADLGSQNPGGHWIRGLQFADLVDLFTYELNNDPLGRFGAPQARMPRGKWAAFHKLAYAVHHRRGAALIHSHDTSELRRHAEQGRSSLTWMATQAIEAYAAGGAYVPFHVEIGSFGDLPLERIWQRVFEHNRFVREHSQLYEGEQTSGSLVAFLFLLNERGRTIPAVFPSYLGLAQGFVEGNFPFDVVFAGDDRYVKDLLKAEDLESYDKLVVPSPIQPTENQKRVIQEFVSRGGVVVCQEPELLGLESAASRVSDEADSWWSKELQHGRGTVRVLSGDVTSTETLDVGTRFYRQYTPELRAQIANLAKYFGLRSMVEQPQSGVVSAFPVVQAREQRLVVHVVNYDVDYENDTIRPKREVQFSIAAPAFLPDAVDGALYHCGQGTERPLVIHHRGDRLEFSIPELGMGAVVEISTPGVRSP